MIPYACGFHLITQ